MKEIFMKDSFLRVISFVIALLLWAYIITVIDPSIDITIKEVPIRYTNYDLIEERDLCVIGDSNPVVELKIKGSRKRIANIDEKNIIATVDLASITKTGTFQLPISIDIPYEYNEIVSKKPYNATVVVDKVITADKAVKVFTTGNTAAGYLAGVAVPDVEAVRLKGSAAMIEKIDCVGAQLDYDGRSSDIRDAEKLFFVDHDGRQINSKNEAYLYVSMSIDTVMVECPVYKMKTVPVEVSAEAFADAYSFAVQPANVTVYGKAEAVAEIERISTKRITASDIEQEKAEVELVLPDDIKLRDGVSKVTVKFEKRD